MTSPTRQSDEEQMPDLFVADLSGPDDAYRRWTVRESLDDFSDWARSEAVRYVPAAGRNVSAKGDEELGKLAHDAFYGTEDSDEFVSDFKPRWIRAAAAVRAAVEEGMRLKLPSQDAIDAGARHMAEEIVANQKLTTLDDARRFARNWIETAAQHARNEEYFRSERDAALARASELQEQLAASEHDRLAALDRVTDARGRADQAEATMREAHKASEECEARIGELEAELAEARVATEARLEMRQQIASAEMRERAAKVCEEYATERVKLKSPAAAGIVMGAKECAARVRELPLTAPPAPAAEKTCCDRDFAHGHCEGDRRCLSCDRRGYHIHREHNSPPARGERWGAWHSRWWYEADDRGPSTWPTREAAQKFCDASNESWPDERYEARPLPAAPDEEKETSK